MPAAPPLEERWYGDIVRPVSRRVAPAVERVRPPRGADPWQLPRAGLGGALIVHAARDFGSRSWSKAGRVAVLSVEAYNQRAHQAEVGDWARSALLERDLGQLNRVWSAVLKRDDVLVARVLARLFGDPADLGDGMVAEDVLFLRLAFGAAAVVGDIPDDLHFLLDRLAIWLGLAMDASRDDLLERSWSGSMALLGRSDPLPSDPRETALHEARKVLELLPDSNLRQLLSASLSSIEAQGNEVLRPVSWSPMLAPDPRPLPRVVFGEEDAFERFRGQWVMRIEDELEGFVATDSQVLTRATDYLRKQGGKRLRPLLTLACAEACGGNPRRALPAAASVEWLHQASLVLDDVIDSASLRRGGVTLHEATSTPFASGIAGFLCVRIHAALRAMHPEIRKRMIDAATRLIDGERNELKHTADLGLTDAAYCRIIDAKTARLFACSAAVGALSVEASRGQVRAATRFGREYGLAFQLIDDLLDYTADPSVFGKRPGTDLRAGKVTLPLLLLQSRLSPQEQGRLQALLRDGASEEDFAWLLHRIQQDGVEEACRERARDHIRRALKALSLLDESPGRDALALLAERCTERRQ